MTTDAQYIATTDTAWDKFVTDVAPVTTTKAQWDTAYTTYISSVEAARIAHGHPAGHPRPRPV